MSQPIRPQYHRAVLLGGALLVGTLLTGCRQDMHDQPKFFPQRGTTLYADGRSVRPQVVGTVARSQDLAGSYFETGMVDGAEGDGLPFKVNMQVLHRGQERFNIYCTPCHSRVGNGKGMIVQRGYYQATSYHSYRLRNAPLGHFFSVISNGYGAMPDLASQITPVDRWAIVAYIRALQLSQNATQADIASGAHVQPISAVLESSGFSNDFLGSWAGAAPQHVHPTVPSATPAPSIPAPETPVTKNAGPVPAPAKTGSKTVELAKNVAPTAIAVAGSPAPQAEKAAGGKGDAAKGKTLYANNCSVCHQPTRAGMPPVFPSLVGVVDRVGEKRVRQVAKEGIPDAKPPMPPHPNFTETDIDDLVAFLRTKP
jgi:mono/diheme cytochrome c family protein